MIWWLFGLTVAVVLGVLDVPMSTLMDSQDLSIQGIWANTLVVGCIFLCHQCWQTAHVSQRWGKFIAFLVGFVLMGVVAFLFLLKAVGARHEQERFVPKDSYTIRATVHIHEISDGVYDSIAGTHYRQKAVLTDLQPVDNLHKYKDNAKHAQNPFGDNDETSAVDLPDTMTVLLTAFANPKADFGALKDAKPNTKTTMTLTISPVMPDKRADGFDGYRWLSTRHIHANAKIHNIDGAFVSDGKTGLKITLETWRWHLREHFYQNWHALTPQDRQNKAITLSLLTGDRSLIDKDTKELYQLGGISHLLAISGTHVVFLALILASMLSFFADKMPSVYLTVSRSMLRLWVMIGASIIYALFTGFDVPAVRAVYMMIGVALARRFALPISSGGVLTSVALVMIWLDPYVLWQAGFWLSFVAVWLLMRYDQTPSDDIDFKQKVIGLVRLQGWLFFAMLPVSLWLFGKVSLWGFVINLFAVGLFGAVIVPINLLAGVLFVVSPMLSDGLWAVSGAILGVLHGLLGMIDGMGSIWAYESMGGAGLLLMVLIVVPFVLPMLSKKYALIPMVALGFLAVSTPSIKGLSITALGDNPTIVQLLVRQDNADPHAISGQANWLILADFDNRLTAQNADSLAKSLTDALKKHKVNHLTGVVVQTPSPILHDVIQKLNKNIIIYRYWHAGRPSSSSLPVLSCGAGELWQGDGLSVRALTGWGQIDDRAVWGCTLAFDGLDGNDDTHIVINGVTYERAWELYAMLCHTPELAPRLTDIWLTHPKATQDDDVMERFSPKNIISDPKNLP
ncbi:MAG: ComEC/Rec2 family competence protein [Moraxella sp.]|nr:ComEC/Rec2 family competence protein [Moraxella sp.]